MSRRDVLGVREGEVSSIQRFTVIMLNELKQVLAESVSLDVRSKTCFTKKS